MTEFKHMNKLLSIALSAAIAAFVVLALLLLAQYRSLEARHLVGPHGSLLSSLKETGTLEPQDASLIETWMTFDYIDRVFSLPPSYLQSELSIRDPRYPRITIEEYAEGAHLNLASTLAAVQAAVRSYTPAQ